MNNTTPVLKPGRLVRIARGRWVIEYGEAYDHTYTDDMPKVDAERYLRKFPVADVR